VKHSIPFGLLVMCALVSGCVASGTAQFAQPDNSVWVCHGGRNAKWKRVSAHAAEGHQRHGDQVSQTPQRQGERCGGGESDRGRDHRN
jgi:hypothetical protein